VEHVEINYMAKKQGGAAYTKVSTKTGQKEAGFGCFLKGFTILVAEKYDDPKKALKIGNFGAQILEIGILPALDKRGF